MSISGKDLKADSKPTLQIKKPIVLLDVDDCMIYSDHKDEYLNKKILPSLLALSKDWDLSIFTNMG